MRAKCQEGFLRVGKVWPKEHKPLHYCGGDTFGPTFPTNIELSLTIETETLNVAISVTRLKL